MATFLLVRNWSGQNFPKLLNPAAKELSVDLCQVLDLKPLAL